ncbi:hypothetical protein K9N68_21590 [Kovacikia minuta CCNUW1]|uniref:hypothetical protein n=1 Tax=Kovacikia minuta TaxID=2931930 RepID=UPI001CCD1ACA|nr:hypothetical protein [Kovacikia minuta]UBF24286.1 hypothetical protein K9N68_21590 [Kovacikia minuta CCNUW1]
MKTSVPTLDSPLPTPHLLKARLVRGLAGVGVTAGLVASVVPAPLAIAIPSPFPRTTDYKPTTGDFNRCTSRLLELKLPTEEATSACARALQPSYLSKCVVRVSREGGVAAIDALSSCRRVRRPDELASCVVQIQTKVKAAAPTEVLDNCTRSLFPDRFADCVVGTTQAAKLPPTDVINTCISGGYFPREVDPTFIPYPLTSVETPVQPEITPAPTYTPPAVTPTPTPTTPAPSEVIPQKY